jgi:diaminopimelate decarboxylase
MLTEAILKNASNNFPTPFYIYDAEQIRKNIQRIKSAFQGTKVHFSLKSNPSPGLCKIISAAGAEAETASPFEAQTAVKSGFDPNQIMYDGPGKTCENIAAVLKLGVKHFNIESMTELERLQTVTAGEMDGLRLCFRINPLEDCDAAEKMTGKPSRFGIDIETLPACLDMAAENNWNIAGIHLYLGSQILSEDQLITNYKTGLDIIAGHYDKFRFKDRTGIEYVFGAGFGIPYQDDEKELDLDYIAENFAKLRAQYEWGNKIISRFELGRYIIANTGKYLARVSDVKVSRGEKFVTLNGGINHFLRYTLTGAHHRVYVLNSNSTEHEYAEICGQTCTPYDVIAKTQIPKDVSEDDIIIINDAGAYGWSMGMQNFLSFPSCAEILFDNGEFRTIRRGSTFDDLMSLNII